MNLFMKTKLMTDSELLQVTMTVSKTEKVATLELLRYLVQVDERRAYATLACSSLFEYVNKILGYSEAQTSERVNSVRLMRSHPGVEKKIESGELSMSTASQVQRFFRQEKKVGNPVTEKAAHELIEELAGKSKREVEKKLLSKSTTDALAGSEKVREVSDALTELKFIIPEVTYQKLQEVKNLIGNESLKEIFDQALDSLLEQTKKKKGLSPKPTLPAKEKEVNETTKGGSADQKTHSRFISIHTKRAVSMRSGHQCEFIEEATGARCESKHRLEFDHYPIPYALGGSNEASNLRHACRAHNLKSAMQVGLGLSTHFLKNWTHRD
jgi:hypothetical protein